MLPKDPMILLSYINTHLRDDYPSLDALCEDLDIPRAELEEKLSAVVALFRRCTLCTSRKSDEIRAQIFRKMPQAYCAVSP